MTELLTPTTLLVLLIAATVALFLAAKLAKDPSWGVVLMAFFLPFERIPNVDVAGLSLKINHVIGGLTFIFLLLAVLFHKRKIASNPIAIPLTLLFVGFLYSGLEAQHFFRHVSVFISLLLMLAIFLATSNGVQNKETLMRVITSLFVGAGLMAIIAVYQFFGDMVGLPYTITGLDPGYTKDVFGFPRVHAFTKEPLYYANYLFIALGIGLALFFSRQNEAKAKEVTIGEQLMGTKLLPFLILLLITFVLTLSRGAFLAAVPFALIFVVLYAGQFFTVRNIVLGLATLIVSLTAVYAILSWVSPDAVGRFIGHATLNDVLVSKSGESGFGRLATFRQAIEIWETSPVVGIGLGNFGPHIANYPDERPETGWQIVNNEYLELLVETGIIGLALVLFMLFILFIRSIIAYRSTSDRFLRAVTIGLTAALVAIFTQYNFFSTFYIIHIWFLFGLLVAVQNIIFMEQKKAAA